MEGVGAKGDEGVRMELDMGEGKDGKGREGPYYYGRGKDRKGMGGRRRERKAGKGICRTNVKLLPTGLLHAYKH